MLRSGSPGNAKASSKYSPLCVLCGLRPLVMETTEGILAYLNSLFGWRSLFVSWIRIRQSYPGIIYGAAG